MTSKKEIVGVLTNFGQVIPVKRNLENTISIKYPAMERGFASYHNSFEIQ